MTDREIAQRIWFIMKGIPLPDSYTDTDVLQIIYRYLHRAMERIWNTLKKPYGILLVIPVRVGGV